MAPETLVAPAVCAGRVVVPEPRRWLDVPLYWQHAAVRSSTLQHITRRCALRPAAPFVEDETMIADPASRRAHYRLRTSLPLGRHGRDRPTYKDAPREGRTGAGAGDLPANRCPRAAHQRRPRIGLGTGTATPEQVSDALAAADAAVRNKQDLQDATRLLRLPEITGEVRRLQFQKTLTLPLGSLAPVAEAFGIDSPLSFTERDWRTRPVVTAVLPLYTGGVIPAAQRAASAAHEQANAEREAQRQSLTVQLAQAYFGQRRPSRRWTCAAACATASTATCPMPKSSNARASPPAPSACRPPWPATRPSASIRRR